MSNVEKIIGDYRNALEEKLIKMNQLDRDKTDLVLKKELDEIENDFFYDARREAFHDLRRQAKSDEYLQQEIMNAQRTIFN